MSVDLTALPIAARTPRLLDFGGLLTPPLGGPVQRIDRVGSRWAFDFVTPVMSAADVRMWAVRLSRAKSERGIVRITQPGLPIGAFGVPVVSSAIAAGKLVPISGLAPGAMIREGQWLTLVVNGQRYLDRATATVTASAAGTATIVIQNLLRVPLVGGEAIKLAPPEVEGFLEGDVEGALDTTRNASFSFTITEAA